VTIYEPGSPEAFDAEWDRCAPWIEAALAVDRGAYGIDDVRQRVENGAARFWAGRDSAVITTVAQHPKFSVLHIWLAGGKLPELRDEILPQIEAYARELGCKMVTIIGRDWSRALGYERAEYVCCKEL
jgi:hypothetical protein